jgi:hypothetical protein
MLQPNRRALLRRGLALGTVGLAGCLDDESQNETPAVTTSSPTAPPSTPEAREWTEGHESTELGDGFVDHGSFGNVVGDNGWVGTSNGAGEDVVLAWLWESGSYTGWLAMLNLETEEYREFKELDMTKPYSSLLSTEDKFYTLHDNFVEFDPTEPGYTFTETNVDGGGMSETRGQTPVTARSLFEDDDGVIWAATHPEGVVVSYDPSTQTFENWGSIFEHDADLFPYTMAVDDTGWVYVCIHRPGVVRALNPDTGETISVVPNDALDSGGISGYRVHRGEDGSVYAELGDQWFECYEGQAEEIDEQPALFDGFDFNQRTYSLDGERVVVGSFRLAYGDLPSGRQVTTFDVKRVDPYLVVSDPDSGGEERIEFDPSGGETQPMGVTTAPDGTLVGGTYIPHQCFNYDPDSDEWFRTTELYGQLNVMDPSS